MAEVSQDLIKRLTSTGPKRILALDGGGIKGAITLGFLGKIEEILANRYAQKTGSKKEDFRLHQYFDLIGGTSTGSIIAALLAVGGYSVAEIKTLYKNLGGKIFSKKSGFKIFGKQIYLNRKYDAGPLKSELENLFKGATLGDTSNKTGLCVVTKRLDTCSTWPVTNNPRAKYFDRNRFPVSEIVRASTAAPSYFEPEMINVGDDQTGIFVDGGLSIMNNPALQLFLIATLHGFNLKWQQGTDNMLVVSVGTGRRDKRLIGKKYRDPKLWHIAKFAPEQFMSDAGETVELMMQYMGKGLGPLRKIDSEMGDLSNDAILMREAFSYIRYNIDLVRESIENVGVKNLSDDQIENLVEMDLAANVDTLMKIGEGAGSKYVEEKHFPEAFNISFG